VIRPFCVVAEERAISEGGHGGAAVTRRSRQPGPEQCRTDDCRRQSSHDRSRMPPGPSRRARGPGHQTARIDSDTNQGPSDRSMLPLGYWNRIRGGIGMELGGRADGIGHVILHPVSLRSGCQKQGGKATCNSLGHNRLSGCCARAHNIVARIHEQDFAGDPRSHTRAQKQGRVRHLAELDITAEW
jgi:hypothetical protein